MANQRARLISEGITPATSRVQLSAREKVPLRQPSQAASLQRVGYCFGRLRIGGLWVVAAVIDVGDPDLARVERVDGHAAGPREEVDPRREGRRGVAPIR